MVTKSKTRRSRKRTGGRSRKYRQAVLGKPDGIIQPRVQGVGLEKFGVVAVDCEKVRPKWMLGDFYGKVVVPPSQVEHDRNGLGIAVVTLKQAIENVG